MDPVPRSGRGGAPEIVDVRAVHSQDQVEALEIGRYHLARLLRRNIEPVFGCNRNRTRIGRGALMPAAGAGRIEQEIILDAALGNHGAEHPFGQRRAADIAEAYEKNGCLGLCDHRSGAMIGTEKR